MRQIALWLLGLWLAFVAFGFVLVPPLAMSLLTTQLGQALGRTVAVERITFNPLKGELQVHGLSVQKHSGDEQFGFGLLQINVSSLSLLQAGLVLDEIRLQAPRVSITRLTDGRYDISDWLDHWQAPGAARPSGTLPRFSLHNIQVTEGVLEFDDRPQGSRHRAQAISFSLPFLSSLPSRAEIWVSPSFSAIVDGAQVSLQGRSKAFAARHSSELSFQLEGLDLARLQPYLPAGLPLRLRSGTLQAELRLGFEKPSSAAPSLRLEGSARVRGLELTEPGGTPWLALQQLDLALADSEPLLGRYSVNRLDLQGLRTGESPHQTPLRSGQLSLEQVQVDLPARRVAVQRLQGQDIAAQLLRTAQGDIQWVRLPATPAQDAGKSLPAALAPAPAPDATSAGGWIAQIGQLSLDGIALQLEDQSVSPAVVHVLEQGQLNLQNLSNATGHANAFNLAGRIRPGGSFKASGMLTLEPLRLQARLETRALPLAAAQAYLDPYLNVDLVQGLLSSAGELDLRVQQPDPQMQLTYRGALTLGQLRTMDRSHQSDFLRWKSLHIDGIDFALAPKKLHIADIALTDFHSRLILDRHGRLNLGGILRKPSPGSTTSSGAGGTQAAGAGDGLGEWPVQIDRITLDNGRVQFTDQFVRLSYSAQLSRLGGSIRNLSSAPGTLADLDLRGQFAGNAPLRISARLNPLTQKKYLDLKAQVSSIDLVDFTPYAGQYAGYRIDKGKLSLNVSYLLQERQLKADNQLFIDQLTFGEKVDSPEATQLPVHLAIALLRNNRGEIDLNLPISGSVDDPQFSVAGLIFKVLGNLLVKAVTSPFALLGSLLGDSQELSHIDFEPGRARLGSAAQQTLQALAKAMREREGLKLEITAGVDPERDAEGLRRLALQRAVQTEKRKDLAKTGGTAAAMTELQIEPGEYEALLRRAYSQARFPKPRNALGMERSLPVEEMEKLMLTHQTVGEQELRALATRRAQATQAWLAEKGQLPLGRLFLLPARLSAPEPKLDGEAIAHRVDFSLR